MTGRTRRILNRAVTVIACQRNDGQRRLRKLRGKARWWCSARNSLVLHRHAGVAFRSAKNVLAETANMRGSINGRRLCGAVTITAKSAKPYPEARHCEMSRRWCGSAYIAVQSDSDTRFTGAVHITRFRLGEPG